MNKELYYTLLTDGTSDKALLPILTWLLQQHLGAYVIHADRAELERLPRPPKTLTDKIERCVALYSCDILFIHRDAEKQAINMRQAEIETAFKQVRKKLGKSALPKIVCVIPVRMTEAWLLFDEAAIRKAAGNPMGSQKLNLPQITKVEKLPDPKKMLYELLKEASGLSGRRLGKFNVHERVHRVANFIEDFSELRQLSAFQVLEDEIKTLLSVNSKILFCNSSEQ
jgi:hypothetical protein